MYTRPTVYTETDPANPTELPHDPRPFSSTKPAALTPRIPPPTAISRAMETAAIGILILAALGAIGILITLLTL